MIGRGSRKLENKDTFNVIDLGNNAARFGLWSEPVNWQHIFKSPEYYLESLRDDTEIEFNFKYTMPDAIRKMFAKTAVVTMDIEEEFKKITALNLRSKEVIDRSITQHAVMCVDNAQDLYNAKLLSKLLADDIESRVKRYVNCLGKTSKNYREWLIEDYKTKLSLAIGKRYRELYLQ
jgi:hypothetical protein